jgi:hypothetical protein
MSEIKYVRCQGSCAATIWVVNLIDRHNNFLASDAQHIVFMTSPYYRLPPSTYLDIQILRNTSRLDSLSATYEQQQQRLENRPTWSKTQHTMTR